MVISKAWANGSTTEWRRIRALVLERDGWVCQLCGEPIPRGLPRLDPRAGQGHHTKPRHLYGDDPRYVVAAHRLCNAKAGDPSADDADPEPDVQQWWLTQPNKAAEPNDDPPLF